MIYGLSTIAGILKAEAELRIEERILELERAAGIAPGTVEKSEQGAGA